MNSKLSIILIVFAAIVVFGSLAFLFVSMMGNGSQPAPEPEDEDVTINFGGRGNPPITPEPVPQTSPDDEEGFPQDETEIPRLRKIYSLPQAGASVFDGKEGSYIRFIDRATGHVYEVTTTSTEMVRLSNTTIPKIIEAFWSKKGEAFIARYLGENGKTIETYSAKLNKKNASSTDEQTEAEQTPYEVTGTYLPRDITVFTKSEADDNIFMIQKGEIANGYMAKMDGAKRLLVFQNDMTEWLSSWPKDNFLVLTSKPSGLFKGSLYFFNIKTKVLEKIMDGFGLTALASPTLEKIVYSDLVQGNLALRVLSVKNHVIINLGSSGFAEKCVWSKKDSALLYCSIPKELPRAIYPDVWYQGQISFNDDLWKINLASGATTLLASPEKEVGEEVDATKLFLNDREEFIFFTNKKDQSLWSLSLNP